MATEPARSKVLQFRVNQDWLWDFDQNLRQLKIDDDETLDRSSFARDLLSTESAFLSTSPYLATSAQHFMLITGQGHLLYRRGELLRLNNDLEAIPGTLAMSTDKREHYSKLHHGDIGRAWMLNNHALWAAAERSKKPLATGSDHEGSDAKSVKLNYGLPAGAVVFREGCFALADYAQTSEGGKISDLNDRVDVLVDIPTRQLEMLVVVDRDLYSKPSPFGNGYQPELSFAISNREQVPFISNAAQKMFEEPRFRRLGSSYPLDGNPDAFYKESVDRIEDACSELIVRLGGLHIAKGVQKSKEAAEQLMELELPKEYLFYRVSWAWPHIGLYLSVKWPKPQKP